MTKNKQSLDYQLLRSLIVGKISEYEGQYEQYGYPHILPILGALKDELKKVSKNL